MTGISNFNQLEKTNVEFIDIPKFNRIWGLDFMLMDSNSFMGGKNGSEYENVIEMFVNIWNENNF